MCHYNIRKYSFCARVVNMWNSLPNDVVEADTVNTFKNRLDKHWYNQDVLFDFNADLIETGSIPICMWSNVCKMRAKRTTCARLNALDWIGLDGLVMWTRLWGRYHVPQNVFLVWWSVEGCRFCSGSKIALPIDNVNELRFPTRFYKVKGQNIRHHRIVLYDLMVFT